MIKAIAFDLGGVLYTYDHDRLMKDVSKELNLPVKEVTEAWKKGIVEFEMGDISEQRFWQIFLNELNITHDLKTLHKLVIEHFQPIKGSLKILNQLKDKLILGLISNQTDWIDVLDKKYNFRKLFDIILISKEVSLRKPGEEIFKLFIEKSGVKPNEIAFIDDFIGYKESVERIGIKFIHYQNPSQLKQDLNKLKVI